MIGMILESRGGRGIRSHWEESPKIPLRCNTEGTLFSRYANSAGNHEEGRFLINEGYCGLQPEGPIHGYSFRGDAARSSGYPCRLDKSCNRSGQPWPDGSLTTSRGFCHRRSATNLNAGVGRPWVSLHVLLTASSQEEMTNSPQCGQ